MVFKLETIDPEDLLKRWKEGETLYASLFVYTDESLREKFNKSIKEFENQSKAISKDHPHGALSVADGLNTLQNTFANYQGYQSANNELKRNLLSKLQLEKVIGLGFEAPIKSSSQPAIIPIHILPNKIYDFDWNESSFSLNGIEFLNIRLIDIAVFEKPELLSNQKKEIELPDLVITGKKVGRPTKKEKIIEAYEFLKKNNEIKYSEPFISHTDLIQQTVRQLNPDITGTEGMQHEAIRRVLSKRFQADKENL